MEEKVRINKTHMEKTNIGENKFWKRKEREE